MTQIWKEVAFEIKILLCDFLTQLTHYDPAANWDSLSQTFLRHNVWERDQSIGGWIIVLLWSCAVTSTIIWSGHRCTRAHATREHPIDTGPYVFMYHRALSKSTKTTLDTETHIDSTVIDYSFQLGYSFVSMCSKICGCNIANYTVQ